MNYRIILFIFLAGSQLQVAVSQKFSSKSRNFTGIIIDSTTNQDIPFVNILNESIRVWAISDTTGKYKIPAKAGDTLVFSVIGYLGKFIVLDDQDIQNSVITKLIPRTYDIAEVEVFGYSSYAQFKQKFQTLEVPETRTDILRENLDRISQEVGREAHIKQVMDKTAGGGNLLSVPILSKEDKERIKLAEIKKEEKIQAIIDKKYNRQIISDLTGLKGDELDDFMLFCKLDRKFLLNASEYDILAKVLERFEAFKQHKKNTGIIQNEDIHADNTYFSGRSEGSPENQKIYTGYAGIDFLRYQQNNRLGTLLQM